MANRGHKIDLLKERRFRYHFDREIYYNRQLRKIFSLEIIEDQDEMWLKRRIDERHGSWKFYFNEVPTTAIKDLIIREIS